MALTLAKSTHVSPAHPSGTSQTGGHGLPLAAELRPLLPAATLRRGGSVGVSGGVGRTSLLLKLLAEPVASGSWAAIVGMPELGVEAADEFGVVLERLALVPDPGSAWLDVTAALLDAIDIVALRPPGSCRPGDAQRLLARARQRHSTLVIIEDAPGGRATGSARPRWPQSPDLTLTATASRWSGLTPGHGTLRHCSVAVTASGRRLHGPTRTGRIRTGQVPPDIEPSESPAAGSPVAVNSVVR